MPQRTMVHSANRTRQLTAVLPDRIGLPNGATISRTALVLPSDFSIEEWQALGTKLGVFREWHSVVARGAEAGAPGPMLMANARRRRRRRVYSRGPLPR